ncbi:hypothetical protein FO519_004286 [Halicephalobus sp. NKZ332]|nr:hypothetical protein FO519_004286 [Halicephalobus sp. NKZ332]
MPSRPRKSSTKISEAKDSNNENRDPTTSESECSSPDENVKDQLEEAQDNASSDKEEKNTKQGRAEKKARQLFSKLDLKPVEGISRVVIRKSKAYLFIIDKPDVYKSPKTDTYIVFGEPRIEDLSGGMSLSDKLSNVNMKVPNLPESVQKPDKKPVIEKDSDDEDEENIDATGIEEKDIELVMSQANVSRKKAIRGLKKNDNDLVNTIMELTL